jgi:CheY-like chemotaxis protein
MSAKALRKTVLLVEDDENDAFLVRKGLEPFLSGWELRVVTDGSEAISYLRGEGRYAERGAYPLPTLVLLDLHLPRVDGVEVLKWIRQEPSVAGLLVVVLTGLTSPQNLKLVYDLHANSLVSKSRLLTVPHGIRDFFGYWLRCNHPHATTSAMLSSPV